MNRALRAALIALAVTAGPAFGQQAPEERIAQSLAQARAAGLPVELLESKVAEGRAKNIPLDRIAGVVEVRAAAMQRAHGVLSGAINGDAVLPEDVAVGADALQAGVADAVLARVATAARGQQRTVAIAALAQLVANGGPPEQALRQVEAALARGNQALMNLPAAAARQGAGPPAGVPASGRPPGTGRPPGAGPPGGDPPGGDPPGGGPPGGGPPGGGPPGGDPGGGGAE